MRTRRGSSAAMRDFARVKEPASNLDRPSI
jgi:hypothetical protein